MPSRSNRSNTSMTSTTTRPRARASMRQVASRAVAVAMPFAVALMLAACKMPLHTDTSAPPSDPFAPAATQLLDNTQWQLVEWKKPDGTLHALPGVANASGAAANAHSAARPITLDLSTASGQRRASGFSGCNRYMGTYTLKDGLLTFGQLAGTRMACIGAGGQIEGAYLDALSHIARTGVQMHPPQSLMLILQNDDRLVFMHPSDAPGAAQPAQ